ncbi:MAG: DUF3788 domain-containing protein [Victivallaceae bacterium]|nr:DUF3788 domain-containing protein [Victivallaceae bacterium]
MAFIPPSKDDLNILLGAEKFVLWQAMCGEIEQRYAIVPGWNPGGKNWNCECKYRKGGRTLCALYAKESTFGFLVILGMAERDRFEAERSIHSESVLKAYDSAATYHDGKWIMFEPDSAAYLDELVRLLHIKRKPDRAI